MPYSVSGYANVIIGSQAASAAGWTGSGCIIIGAGAASVNAAGAGQIILGDINSALYVQGSLNYRWGAQITGNITVAAPIAQLYLIGDAAAAFTITLPSVAYLHSIGAMVTFRRTGTSPKTVNFQVLSGETLYPDHSTTAQGGPLLCLTHRRCRPSSSATVPPGIRYLQRTEHSVRVLHCPLFRFRLHGRAGTSKRGSRASPGRAARATCARAAPRRSGRRTPRRARVAPR